MGSSFFGQRENNRIGTVSFFKNRYMVFGINIVQFCMQILYDQSGGPLNLNLGGCHSLGLG